MSIRIGLLLIFMIFLAIAHAQEKLNYLEVDQQSYALFLEKKWPELIELATEAREKGIDFFYLQARTGIAWYNQGKYRNAAHWFLKAYENDKSLEWLQEYVYYSLLFSGRKAETVKYAYFFSDELKKKIGFLETGITRLAYETGHSYNTDFENLKARDFNSEINLGNDYGEAYFLKNYSFHSFDLSHKIASKLALNHNLTYIGVNREAVVDWGTLTNSPIRINQFNYFINPVLIIGTKLNISPSLSMIMGSGDVYAGFLTNDLSKGYRTTKTNYSDAIFSTAIWSDYRNFSPGFEINAGKINDSKFTQVSTWLTFYPLSNTKLYVTPRIYFKSENDGFGFNAAGISGGATLGKIHFYGNYLWGDMENFVESNGYLVTNFPGTTEYKLMGSAYLPLNNNYQLVFRYINQKTTEKYQVYSNGTKANSMEYEYSKNTITAGIVWNF